MKNQVKKCPVCGADMATSAKACPQCGAKNKKPIYKRVWFWLLVIVIILGAGAALGGSDEPTKSEGGSLTGSVEEEPENKNVFGDFELVGKPEASRDEFDYLTIKGSIKNISDDDAEYCQVEFYVYDKDGNALDNAVDNIGGIKAGKTWKFEAMSLDEEAESWEIKEITGW